MAMLGFPLYVSIILCLTVEIYSDLTISSAIAELRDRMDDLAEKTSVIERQLNTSIDSINLKIDKLGHFTEEGNVVKTSERVIKAFTSEKAFVRKGLSELERRFKDFQKTMDEQMTVLNSTIEASRDNLERKPAENDAQLSATLTKLQENNLTICSLPLNAATPLNYMYRTLNFAGTTWFRDQMECTQEGYTLSSVKFMTCQENGTWTDIIRCHKTEFSYLVRINAAGRKYAGLSVDNVEVRIYGHEEHTAAFRMNAVFRRNEYVEHEFRGIDIRPIKRVSVSKGYLLLSNELVILNVTIFIEDSDDYYVFTFGNQTGLFQSAKQTVELSISPHPERCIHTYGKAMNRSPKSKHRGRDIGHMLLRECKQRCVTTLSLSCNSIFFMPWKYGIRGFGRCFHYTQSPDSNLYFKDNNISETSNKYVSYKRICREP